MLPATKADLLGHRFATLSGDDGPQLASILAELQDEVHREPTNLVAATAYAHGLLLGGRRAEAHAEAARCFQIWRRLPAVPPAIALNVATEVVDAKMLDEAKEVVVKLESRTLDSENRERLSQVNTHLAFRFGELEWLADREPKHYFLEYLRHHQLAAGWPSQQQAVEAFLGGRVLSASWETLALGEGAYCLAVDYFTDALSFTQLETLQVGLWATLEVARGDEFRRLVQHVTFTVYGPRIPLEGIQP